MSKAIGARELTDIGTHSPAATLAITGKLLGRALLGVGRRAPMANCAITNVPGPSVPIYLNGARMTYFSAIMPISDGMGLGFSVTSYDGRIIISPTSCREQIPDPEFFALCIRESFQEYLDLAGRAAPGRAKPARGRAASWRARWCWWSSTPSSSSERTTASAPVICTGAMRLGAGFLAGCEVWWPLAGAASPDSGARVVGALTGLSSFVSSSDCGARDCGARKNPRQRKLLYEGCASMLVGLARLGTSRHQRADQLLRAIRGSS
jgi:hypothetical protein